MQAGRRLTSEVSVPMGLWEEVRECFETDDGSLPGVYVTPLSPAGMSAIYAMIRRRSRLVGVEQPVFWSRTHEQAVEVDAVVDAAALVAAGEAEPFIHCVGGLVAGGVELPELGVFVWGNAVELDYRMGRGWGPAQVEGFFELLWDCCNLDQNARVIPADCEGPPFPEKFSQAWDSYRTKKAEQVAAKRSATIATQRRSAMHPPPDAKLLSFPVHLKPYIVGGFHATREELRAALGTPHFVETDSTRTFGGDEDMWAWELPSGQRMLIVLQVPYEKVMLHCDPPNARPVVTSLGIDADAQRLEILTTPVVRPDYSGP